MSGQSLYKITDDIIEFDKILEEVVDEEGNPREPTPEEWDTLQKWCDQNLANFTGKVDSYCRFIKNLDLSAKNAKAEYDNFKEETTRLSRRKAAFENRAKTVKNLLWYCMQRLDIHEYKTDYFSLKEQNTQKSITVQPGTDLSTIPEEYLKPRELDIMAVKEGLKSGALVQDEDNPLHKGKVYIKGADGKDMQELKGVIALQGKTLYIR